MADFSPSLDQEVQGLRSENERLRLQLSGAFDALQDLVDAVGFVIQGPRPNTLKKQWKTSRDLLDQKGL